MTKQEYIERYGLEAYEQYKIRNNASTKERYQNDPEFRESRKARDRAWKKERRQIPEYRESMNERNKVYIKARYVEGGRIDLIENYELAKHDNFEGWLIHHKLGIGKDYRNSKEDLKLMNLYYNRPPEELIWLTSQEHNQIHHKGRTRT